MPDQLLTIFRICFLVLLYLFFFRVLRAIWTEITAVPAPIDGDGKLSRSERKALKKGKAPKSKVAAAPAPAVAPTPAPAPPPSAPPQRSNARPTAFRVIEPAHLAGMTYTLADGLSFGRGGDSSVVLDDTFLSSNHLRIAARGSAFYAEDLNSTNGTYVNRVRVSGPVELSVGDHVQMGNVVVEVI